MDRKRKRSKITMPNNGSDKTLQAFRADREITRLLNQVPNKSEFIVEALREKLSHTCVVTCPTCKGAGKVIGKK